MHEDVSQAEITTSSPYKIYGQGENSQAGLAGETFVDKSFLLD